MRIFTITSLLVASVLIGCSDKAAEVRLTSAANIFARFDYGWFDIEYFDTKIDNRHTMHFTYKRTGRSFSVSENGECKFVFRWKTDITDTNEISDFSTTTSIVDFTKLNLKDAQFFKSQMQGFGILEISGVEGAVTHLARSGPALKDAELRITGIPIAERDLYLDRVKTMQEKICKGRT